MKFYLAGPVGYGPEGTTWKDDIKCILRSKGHEVYDPIENDGKYPDVLKMNIFKFDPKKYYKEIHQIMQEIFFDDCDYITNCNYLICYFSGRSYGTVSEQGIAYYLNKFLHKNIQTISIFSEEFSPDEWVLCCSNHVFFSKEDALAFLQEIK